MGKRLLRLTAVLTLAVAMTGCFDDAAPAPAPPPATPEIAEAPEPVILPPAEALLVAAGDVMMHTPQLPGAYDSDTGQYDFTGFFKPVQPILSEADWAVVNLETPIAGDGRGFHGYPRFNAPEALADALADAGFHVVSTANNHSLDQGADGLVHTLNVLRDRGLRPIGTADSEEAARGIAILERNGISAAFLSYTYGTNGIPVPEPYFVNLIDETQIADDISRARRLGADFVSVSLHFGNEYERRPNEAQKQLAQSVIAAGGDLVIGHHPHVVQPYEFIQANDSDGRLRDGLVMYSLGNFISNQFGDYKEFGAILKLKIVKEYGPDGVSATRITDVDAIPTWVHKYVSGGKNRYRILSLDEVTQAHTDPLITNRTWSMLTEKAAEMNAHLESLTEKADTMPLE